MRTARALAVTAALTGSALLSLPASAAEVCDRNCVGPLCGEKEKERWRGEMQGLRAVLASIS
jgi:hypothetical protein